MVVAWLLAAGVVVVVVVELPVVPLPAAAAAPRASGAGAAATVMLLLKSQIRLWCPKAVSLALMQARLPGASSMRQQQKSTVRSTTKALVGADV